MGQPAGQEGRGRGWSLLEPMRECDGHGDVRDVVTPALHAGCNCNALPVIPAALGAFRIEFDQGFGAENGLNHAHTEFGRFFDDPVHFVAQRQGLSQAKA